VRFLGFIVVVALVVTGGAWLFLDTLVKAGAERFGSRLTGTQVSVQSVAISLLRGHARIDGLAVANPAGFSAENAVSFGSIEVKLVPASLLHETIRIEHIVIQNPAIVYELNEKGTNIDTIMANINKATAGAGTTATATPSGTPATTTQPADKGGKKVQIDRVEIKNTRATMSASILGQGSRGGFDVPDILLKDIGTKNNGVTVAEAVQQVVGPIMGSVATMSPQDLSRMKESVKGIADDIATGIKGIGSSLKGMFSGAKE
jgi:hypothetical protein